MAIITDPDLLSQGKANTATSVTMTANGGIGTSNTIFITGSANLPSVEAGDYFEIRGSLNANNNALYVAQGATGTELTTSNPTTSVIHAVKKAGDGGFVGNSGANTVVFYGANTDITATASNSLKSVYFDYYNRDIWLLPQTKSNLSNDTTAGGATQNGATLQSIYSFAKEEWKNDSNLIPHPFPFVAITPEQFEIDDGWKFNNASVLGTSIRKLVRTGGWREIEDNASTVNKEYVGVISLGSFEDNINDTAYYQQGNDPTNVTNPTTDFTFSGPVNEAILSYDYATANTATVTVTDANNTFTRTTGSWLTEGYRVGGQITVVTSSLGNVDATTNAGTPLTITSISSGAALSLTVSDPSGTFTTGSDPNFSAAVNNRNVLNVFLRIRDGDLNGKTFDQSNLPAIGVTEVDNKVFRFPLSNATDLKISETDANISTTDPYQKINIKYFNSAYTLDVDDPSGSNPRSFGIVIDVNSCSGIDLSTTGASNTVTTVEGGLGSIFGANSYFSGGELTIHSGNDKGTYYIARHTETQLVVSPAPATGDTGASFTVTPGTANTIAGITTNQIYEKVQYQLRQSTDVDETDDVISGKTADALLRFVGDELESGQAAPSNPNGGGTGVIVQGFPSSITNDLTFYDNSATSRTYPFVASGTINFNNNLQNDSDAKFWLFFRYTKRTTTTNAATIASVSGSRANITISSGAQNFPTMLAGDYVELSGFTNADNNDLWRIINFNSATDIDAVLVNGTAPVAETSASGINVDQDPIDSPDAIIVNDNDGNPITNNVGAQSSVEFSFDYDNNAQGYRTAGQGNAQIIIRAIGFDTAQFVEQTGEIAASTTQSYSLVSALERNYSNP